MTRKDMIKLMELAYHESKRGGMSEMTDSERMEYVLSKMEQAGILPPKIQFTMGDKEVVDYTWEKQ